MMISHYSITLKLPAAKAVYPYLFLIFTPKIQFTKDPKIQRQIRGIKVKIKNKIKSRS